MSQKLVKVTVSGAFDPIHVGHIRYIREAAKLGDRLVVILNKDDFLLRKKGLCSGRSTIEKRSWKTSRELMRLLPLWMRIKPYARRWN